METTYSISELEKVTGLSKRTIHYYTMEKLIPPPEGAGISAKYREEHLLRLKLIGTMQKSHIRLSGIREALEAMTIEDMRRLVREIDQSKASWDFASIKNWIGSSSHEPQSDFLGSVSPGIKMVSEKDYSFISPSRAEKDSSRTQNDKPTASKNESNYLGQLKRKTVVDDTSWRRLVIADGLEINIRSDVEQKHGQLIIPLIEQIKKIL